MQIKRWMAGGLLVALPAALANAQTAEYERVGTSLWRTQGNQRWAVNQRLATLKLATLDFANWRAGLPSASLLRRLSAVRANRLGWIDVNVPADVDALEILNALRADERVSAAELSAIGSYSGVPNDPNFGLQWHLRNTGQTGGTPGADIGATSAWDISVGAPGVVIAIVDSGTEITHPDLAANIWLNAGEIAANGIDDDGNGFIDDTHGWDFEHANPDVAGTIFHGTTTAGAALARTNNAQGVSGVAGGFQPAEGCRGMILAVGDSAPQSALLDDAILYAADNGARIISMSLQVPSSAAINAALQYAHDVRGVTLVAAAGNSPSAVTYPANQSRVIAVGSTNSFDARSAFSAIGPELWLVAPGENIRTTTIGASYASFSGTSYSAPIVAGSLGLMFAYMPSLSADDAREVLKLTARDLGVSGFDNLTGWGRVSASAALAKLVQSDCDGNGIYDPRQIANGTSLDVNGNGVPDECELVTYCMGTHNSLGCIPAIVSQGSSSASANSGFVISALSIRNQRPGLLMYSFAGRATLPVGSGTLCVAAPIRRTISVDSGGSPTGADCSGVLSVDMNAFASGALGGSRAAGLSTPGLRVSCQWWSSDPLPGAPNNPSFSDALEYSVAP